MICKKDSSKERLNLVEAQFVDEPIIGGGNSLELVVVARLIETILLFEGKTFQLNLAPFKMSSPVRPCFPSFFPLRPYRHDYGS